MKPVLPYYQGCAFGQKFSVFPTDARPETKFSCVSRPNSDPTENCPKTRKLPESPNRVGSEPFFGPENPRFPRVSELKKGNLLVYEENIVFECKDLTLIITFYQT